MATKTWIWSCPFVVLLLFVPHLGSIGITETVDSDSLVHPTAALGEDYTVSNNQNDSSVVTTQPEITTTFDYLSLCPSNVECSKLGGDCIDCDFKENCFYGRNTTADCRPKPDIVCTGQQEFKRSLVCRYCYQTQPWEQICTSNTDCHVVSAPRQRYLANCSVKLDVLCLGRRRFYKMKTCNWTSGYRWTTALALSVTLGGFGVDRFYLGLWREGIGKLFSFGGLGVWTLVDVVLIATGYVGPADGSLYIY